MHDDAGDRLRVGQAGVREGPGAVGRLVDADAGHGRAEEVRLAGANPDDVGIRGRDRDVADARRGLVLEDGLPRRAVVVGLPHAARRIRGVDAPRAVFFRDGDVGRAPADVGGTERLPRRWRDTATTASSRDTCRRRSADTRRRPVAPAAPGDRSPRTRPPPTEPTTGRECRTRRRASRSSFQRITPHRDIWRAAP